MSKVNDFFFFKAGFVKLEVISATPQYGYNFLRWLFRQPASWDVKYKFIVRGD